MIHWDILDVGPEGLGGDEVSLLLVLQWEQEQAVTQAVLHGRVQPWSRRVRQDAVRPTRPLVLHRVVTAPTPCKPPTNQLLHQHPANHQPTSYSTNTLQTTNQPVTAPTPCKPPTNQLQHQHPANHQPTSYNTNTLQTTNQPVTAPTPCKPPTNQLQHQHPANHQPTSYNTNTLQTTNQPVTTPTPCKPPTNQLQHQHPANHQPTSYNTNTLQTTNQPVTVWVQCGHVNRFYFFTLIFFLRFINCVNKKGPTHVPMWQQIRRGRRGGGLI